MTAKHFKSITVYLCLPNIVKSFSHFQQQKYILYHLVLSHYAFTVFDMGMSTKKQRNPKIIWKWWNVRGKPMDLEGQFGLTQPHHTPSCSATCSTAEVQNDKVKLTSLTCIHREHLDGDFWRFVGPVARAGVGSNSDDIWANYNHWTTDQPK